MKLKAKVIGLETGGKPIVILNKEDAEDLGATSLSRIRASYSKKEIIAIVNISRGLVENGAIGISEEVRSMLELKNGEDIEVEIANVPSSMQFIRNRLNGRRLTHEELSSIIKDILDGYLSEIEIASFVVSLHNFPLDIEEASSLSMSMVDVGERLELKKKVVCDKHSIGGIAGDKTSLILVPIIASLGLTIPKTSARAITGAAGSADRAECLMPVSLKLDEMREVVEKTNGCLVWGGSLHLSPVDDIFIQVEYPLSIDPLRLPSIMSKKKAVGATHLVIDIPNGRGSKVKSIDEAGSLARDFIMLGGRLGINVNCAITYGEEPLGYTIGPALEAREALRTMSDTRLVPDVVDKVTSVAGILLEMAGKRNGKELAMNALKSGKAESKMREIISAQGGDEKITAGDVAVGDETYDVLAERGGHVFLLSNSGLIQVARAAGAPRDKGAGIELHKKLYDKVEKGEKLLTIYAEKSSKIDRAVKVLDSLSVIGISDRKEMLVRRVEKLYEHHKYFILER